ncbi:MAG: hypothetical protein EA403_12490 [Spirochaetaceae bacterium]|nr:MAG: hypothetical protein EA403_12490 [Spirochaetaceae bacterium]
MHRWLTGDGWWFALVPAAETIVIFLLAVIAAALTGRRRLAVVIGAAVMYGTLSVYAFAESLFQFIYARSFVPAADIPMVRGALLLLFGQIGDLATILKPVAIGLILVVFWSAAAVVIWFAARLLARLNPPRRTVGVIAAASIMLLAVVPYPTVLSATVVSGLAAGGNVEFEDVVRAATVNEVEATEEPLYAFPGIMDRDIYVFVIEAYGYAAFSRPELFAQLEPDFRRFEEVLTRAGYGITSNFLLAPVAGGFSWLAEATFLTGQWINSQPVFEQLYEAPVSTIPSFLLDGGYFTFTVKPGTVHGSWPEGWDLFRFKESMIAYDGDFTYRGPWFSFVPITDQFAIHAAHQRLRELRAPGGAAEHRPIFAYYQLVSSHTPFNRIPPYIEEWDLLGDGSIYHELSDQILTFDNTWTGGTQLEEGYVASISYVFTVISEYIDRFLDHSRNPIIIVFGDHQAQRPIREQNAHLSVPIHVASRDPDILERFAQHGFTSGVRGEQPPPHPRMSEFFRMFVDVARNVQVAGHDAAD